MNLLSKIAIFIIFTGGLAAPATASITSVSSDEVASPAPYTVSPETEIQTLDSTTQMMIRDAIQLGEKGRAEEARALARRIQQEQPNLPEVKWLRIWLAYYEKNYSQALAMGTEYLNVNPSATSIILPTLASAAMMQNREAMDRVIFLIPMRSRDLPVCSWAVAFQQALGGRKVQSSPPIRLRIGAEHIRPFISFLRIHGDEALQRCPAQIREAFYTDCLGAGTDKNLAEIIQIFESGALRASEAQQNAAMLRLEALGVRIQMTELARAQKYRTEQQWDKFDAIMVQILPLRRLDGALWMDYARNLYERGKYPESATYALHALKVLPSSRVDVRFLALGSLLMNQRAEEIWPIMSQLATLAPAKVIQWIKDNQNEPEFIYVRSDPRYLKLVHALNWREGESLALAPEPGEPAAAPATQSAAPSPQKTMWTLRYAAGAILALGMAGFVGWLEHRRRARRRHSRRHSSSKPGEHEPPPSHQVPHSEWSPKSERMRRRHSRP